MNSESFVIERIEFYRKLKNGQVRFENEYIPTWDRYDLAGRWFRHFAAIGYVRWDGGDPGDEHHDNAIRECIADAYRDQLARRPWDGE